MSGIISNSHAQEKLTNGARIARAEWQLQQLVARSIMNGKILRELYLENHTEVDYEELFFVEPKVEEGKE